MPPALTWKQETTSGAFEAIWGTSPTDIYAVGQGGDIRHSMGDGTWDHQSTDTGAILTGVWGSGPDDIYVSANSNFILHSTGDGEWEHQDVTSGITFNDIWGASASKVYVVAGASVMESDGSGYWEVNGSAPGSTMALAIWGSSATDLYLGGVFTNTPPVYRSTGDGKWSPQAESPQRTINDISGTGPDHIYVAASGGTYFSRGDGRWTLELESTSFPFDSVWAANREAVYACTQDGTFFRSNGAGTWSEPEVIDDSKGTLGCYCIWGTDPGNIYVCTAKGIYHGTSN